MRISSSWLRCRSPSSGRRRRPATGAFTGAREALDEAETGLQVLRERWPEMAAAERALVGRAAAPVKERLDAVARRLPRPSALSEVAAEHDPEQEQDPAAAA